ncbi:GRAS family protein TF80 [Zea mays]|jgi:hypothetical protein|eukprot:XP_020395710.2 scarecrow-like protein 3 [Zea mays]
MSSGNLYNSSNKGKAVLNLDLCAPMPVEAVPLMAVGSGEPAVRSSAEAMPAAATMAAAAAAAVIRPGGSQSQQLDKSLILLVKCVMQHCVRAMEAGNTEASNNALAALSSVSSLDGDPIQRLTSAFTEALARRALEPLLQGLPWAIKEQLRRPPPPAYADVARQWFHTLSPLLRAAGLAANHAIVKALEGEQDVHVVDLGGANPRQWVELLRLLAARPGGAPSSSLRLTIVSDHACFLSCATGLLTAEATRLHVPLALNPVRSHIDNFSAAVIAALGVQRGQAVVISSTLQLHRLIADTTIVSHRHAGRQHDETMTRADALLHVLRDLSPKLLVLTEQEADHNDGEGRGLWDRVDSAFDYYAVLFNDLEVSRVPRESLDRAVVERLLLREEIVDIIARDGAARRERHEKLLRWVPRMLAAGFQPALVGMDGFKETTRLADRLSDGDGQRPLYRVVKVKEKGCFFVHSCWTPMFSVSLWQPAPGDHE